MLTELLFYLDYSYSKIFKNTLKYCGVGIFPTGVFAFEVKISNSIRYETGSVWIQRTIIITLLRSLHVTAEALGPNVLVGRGVLLGGGGNAQWAKGGGFGGGK